MLWLDYYLRILLSIVVSKQMFLSVHYRFPLYLKGSERALFQYAVYLLNKDIAQVFSCTAIDETLVNEFAMLL